MHKKSFYNTSFTERVRAVVRAIPKGKVATYGEVARRAGSSRAARAVGMIMSQNHDASVPCHRVVRSDGKMAGYNGGGIKKKIERLIQEGVHIENGRASLSDMVS